MNIKDRRPISLVVVGDAFISPQTMEDAMQESKIEIASVKQLFWGSNDKQEFTEMQLKIERNGSEAVSYAKGLKEAIESADVLMTHFCPIPRELIEGAKKLKAILSCRGGLEHICVEAASEKQIPVINVIRNAEPVADFVLGMCYSLTRNIGNSYYRLRNGEWQKEFYNSAFLTTLDRHIVGLAGVGNVGIAFARRLLALNVPVIAYDAFISKERLIQEGLEKVELIETMEELFSRADIVSLHLRLTKETEKLIDRKYFSLMKETSYFINTARGGLVHQEDLIEVLCKKQIAGAALDVFDSEPFSKDSPLLKMDNVLLTPHIAGTTVDAISKSPYALVREIERMMEDQTHGRIVNFEQINGGK